MKKLHQLFLSVLVFSLLIQVGCSDSEPSQSPPKTTIPQSEEIPVTEPVSEPDTTSENEPLLNEEPDSDPDPMIEESRRPLLSDALIRNCEFDGISDNLAESGLAEGDTAVDFTLNDINGNMVNLSELLIEKPVLMVFGSFT
ncbi:hypothetical protein ACFLUP_00110 [Chloroflexota bacterium]